MGRGFESVQRLRAMSVTKEAIRFNFSAHSQDKESDLLFVRTSKYPIRRIKDVKGRLPHKVLLNKNKA